MNSIDAKIIARAAHLFAPEPPSLEERLAAAEARLLTLSVLSREVVESAGVYNRTRGRSDAVAALWHLLERLDALAALLAEGAAQTPAATVP